MRAPRRLALRVPLANVKNSHEKQIEKALRAHEAKMERLRAKVRAGPFGEEEEE